MKPFTHFLSSFLLKSIGSTFTSTSPPARAPLVANHGLPIFSGDLQKCTNTSAPRATSTASPKRICIFQWISHWKWQVLLKVFEVIECHSIPSLQNIFSGKKKFASYKPFLPSLMLSIYHSYHDPYQRTMHHQPSTSCLAYTAWLANRYYRFAQLN